MFVFTVTFDDFIHTAKTVAANDVGGAIHIACELSQADGDWFTQDNVQRVERGARIQGVQT